MRFTRFQLLNFLLALVLGLSFGAAFAHDDDLEGVSHTEVQRLAEITQMAIALEAIIFPEGAARLDVSLRLQSELAKSGMRQLLEGYSRHYYQSLCKVCGPQPLTEEIFLQQLSAEPGRRGLVESFSHGLNEKLFHGIVDVAMGAADIGARLGRTILIMKAASEAIETVGSVFLGLKGLHLFCNAIDVGLLFGSRHMQTAARSFALAPLYDDSRFKMFFKRMFIAAQVRSVFNRTQLEIGPLDVDEEILRDLDAQGPRRNWGFFGEHKRAKFVHWVDRKLQKNPEKNVHFAVSRKDFLGKRLKRSFFVLSRKRDPRHLANQQDNFSRILQKEELWVFSLQEGIINLADRRTNQQNPLPFSEVQARTPLNSVSQGLLNEAALEGDINEAQSTTLRILLHELEWIFDPEKSHSSRYERARLFEVFFSSFLYRLMQKKWKEQAEELNHYSEIPEAFKERYRKGQFALQINHFADFLRVAASSSHTGDRQDLKFASADHMIRIFRHLQLINRMDNGEIDRMALTESLQDLVWSSPFIQRGAAFKTGWFPFWRHYQCESI